MAGALTDYLENAILNHTLRNVPYTAPAAVYVGLFTAAPGETGGGTEVSGGGYTRVQATFGAPSNGACSNSAEVLFPKATASWGTVTHFAIFDAATAGNMLYYGALAVAQTVNVDTTVTFEIGTLTVSLD